MKKPTLSFKVGFFVLDTTPQSRGAYAPLDSSPCQGSC